MWRQGHPSIGDREWGVEAAAGGCYRMGAGQEEEEEEKAAMVAVGFPGDYQEKRSLGRDWGLSAKTCSEQLPGFQAR